MRKKMKVNNLIVLMMMLIEVFCACPNGCSGHGKCVSDSCVCFDSIGTDGNRKSYTGNDCSLLRCEEGYSFSSVVDKEEIKGGVNGGVPRELSMEMNKTIRELSYSRMKLENQFSESVEDIWKVSGISEILKDLPMSGGFINCDVKVEGASVDKKVEVLGINKEKTFAYVKFSGGGESSIKKETTVITCDVILSKRKTMVYVNSDIIVNQSGGGQGRRLLNNNNTRELQGVDLSWNYYGKIYQDLGILEKQETTGEGSTERRRNLESEIYEKKDFSFACYTPPTISTSSVEITIYTGIIGTYTYTEGDTDGKLIFTFPVAGEDGSPPAPPDENSICNCLMSGDITPISIENTELIDFVEVTVNGQPKYSIGKYSSDTIDPFGFAVIKTTDAYTASNSIIITIPSSGHTDFISDGRVVYIDVYKDGVFSEEKGSIKVTEQQRTTTIKLTTSGITGVMLPYIKTHSSNPLIDPPPSKSKDPVSEGSLIYKVYNLGEKLIIKFNEKLGGILKCSYENGEGKTIEISADVKRYIKKEISNAEVIAYSYIEFSDDNAVNNIDKMKCSGISLIRSDFTMYNPVKLVTADDGSGNYDDNQQILTWKGYKEVLKDVIIVAAKEAQVPAASAVNFACYTPNDDNRKEEIILYTVVTIAIDDTGITFAISNTGKKPTNPSSGDICYLAAKLDKNNVNPIEKGDLLSSDLKEFIRGKEDGEVGKLYYGKFQRPTEGINIEFDKNNELPIFVFDNNKNKIEESKIKMNEKDINNNILEYFVIGETILIEIIKEDDNTKQYNHKAIITSSSSSSSSSNSRILLSDSIIEVSFSPGIPNGFKSFGNVRPTLPTSLTEIVGDKPLDSAKHLYEVSYFYTSILSKLPLLGGKIQCEYKETTVRRRELIRRLVGDTKTSVMGIVDIKAKDGNGNSFIQFDYAVEKEPAKDLKTNTYFIDDINCNEIQLMRNDMTLLNPTKITTETDGNYNSDTHILTWTGYKDIFTVIRFKLNNENPPNVKFACYNPSEAKKKIIIYEKVEAKAKDTNNIEFIFKENNEPKEGNICYLLCNSNGDEIGIESSDLFELIRKEEDGEYYYGKYVDITDDTKITIENSDGSVTQILGSKSFSITDDKEDKIYIGNLGNEKSPSISYPASLISDGVKKYLIVGSILKINGILTQILKIRLNEKTNKFELLLSQHVVISKDIRLLNNRERLLVDPPSSISITFLSSGSTHKKVECSGQGICNRENGLCECYDGFSGSGCERMDCPSNCNGNGRCVSLSELLSNSEIENNYEGFGNKQKIEVGGKSIEIDNQVYGCLCDKRHRGYDCSLIECPSGVDPEGVSNKDDLEYRDCSGRGICNYSSGICECFSGFSGEGCQNMIETM